MHWHGSAAPVTFDEPAMRDGVMTATVLLGLAAAISWGVLIVGRGYFWLCRERDDRGAQPPAPSVWPSVTAVVPARNEADVVARSIGSLLAQDYPGEFKVILVDDNSDDGTGSVARACPNADRLTVITGAPPPAGWTGKLWAVKQGVGAAPRSDYLWLTDADIAHTPGNLRQLVARAEAGGQVLTSLMAQLAVTTWAERPMIPAFVYFFAMLYPFAWANSPIARTAAAAGGCMLVRRAALEAAGGIDAIRTQIIDDCALARLMKAQGPIWLGLTHRAVSLRPYGSMGEIGRMIARSAYAQLGFSPVMLLGTLLAMTLVFVTAPALTLFGHGSARWLGLATWFAMAWTFQPMLRFYRQSPLWGLAMPVIAAVYTSFTIKSALDVWAGRGGMWKGRAQAVAAQS